MKKSFFQGPYTFAWGKYKNAPKRENNFEGLTKLIYWAFPEIVRNPPVEDIGYPGGSQKIGYPGGVGISSEDIQGVNLINCRNPGC